MKYPLDKNELALEIIYIVGMVAVLLDTVVDRGISNHKFVFTLLIAGIPWRIIYVVKSYKKAKSASLERNEEKGQA